MVVIEDYIDDDAIASDKKHNNNNNNNSDNQRHDKKSLTPLQQEGLQQVCSHCGLGPRLLPQQSSTTIHGVYIPLKRCSVCHQAWYHDRTCQQAHYPRHKKVCQKRAKQQAKQLSNKIKAPPSICRVVQPQPQPQQSGSNTADDSHKHNRGRCVVANRDLKFGTLVGPHNAGTVAEDHDTSNNKINNNNQQQQQQQHWTPIVAPVLLDNHRLHRCVVCFGLVTDASDKGSTASNVMSTNTTIINNNKNNIALNTYYPTRLCSDACRRTAASFLPSELQAIAQLFASEQDGRRPPMILPTAVLLYRCMLAIERDASGAMKGILLDLQSERHNDLPHPQPEDESNDNNNNNNNNNTKEDRNQQEQAHEQAVCATAWAMMHATGSLPTWHWDDVQVLLQQIKLNGFSVCTAESVALGVGLYTALPFAKQPQPQPQQHQAIVAPNLINHNCRPNLLQTFDYQVPGQFPTLRLTVCTTTVAANEELTLSYIDNTMPTRLRQPLLQSDYGFVCRCVACQDHDDDTLQVTGYKCPQRNCNTGLLQFHCTPPVCHRCDTPLSEQGKRLQQLLEFQSIDIDIDTKTIAKLEQAYQSNKQTCIAQSWYVREAGERLLQALLDALGQVSVTAHDNSKDAQKQYALAAQAFQLTEELLQSSRHYPQPSGEGNNDSNNDSRLLMLPKNSKILRDCLLLYKSIKLRLFLNIHPQQAMQELERIVLPTCNAFFPSHHEIMRQIVQDCCL